MLVLVGISSVIVGRVRAHDIPDERVDRAIQIRLEPPDLRVSYEVSLSEWTLFQDLKRLAPELPPGDRNDRIEGYARIIAPLNARGLLASVDGSDLVWTVERFEVDFEQHALLTFHFVTDIPKSGRLIVRDTNYVSSYGTSRLAMSVSPETRSTGDHIPPELVEVPEVPLWAMTDEQEERTRRVDVVYFPSGDEHPELETRPIKAEEEVPKERTSEPISRNRQGDSDRLTGLFLGHSERSMPLLLLAALVIGAAHAVQPGHGKTLVVGASIQGTRPIGRGLLLAGTAALSHFAVAVALAVLAVVLVPKGFDRIDSAITRGIGLLLGIVGAWRIGVSMNATTLRERGSGRPLTSSRDAILSGMAIGAIPCWDAVLLLALAWVTGQPTLGVALLVAFSVGASATLLSVAVLAGLFRSIARRLTASPILERSLGMLGGLLLAGIGGYLFLG
jgi:ABC-type nickel/cobalt efflux system permease component RcnA